MLTLAFETSAKAASVALMDGRKLLGESYQNTGLTHSQLMLDQRMVQNMYSTHFYISPYCLFSRSIRSRSA